MLTPEEKAHFEREGYLVKSGVYDAAAMAPIREAIDEMVEFGVQDLVREGKLEHAHADLPFERRLARIHRDEPQAAMQILARITGKGGGGYSGPAMLHCLRHPPLLACLEVLLGSEVLIGSSAYRIRPKLPGYERGAVPWHQDSGYFMEHCDDGLIVTCWIPLVDATLETGCLYVIPRAHNGGVMRHYTGGPGGFLVIDDSDLPAGEQIPLEMKAGDVLFMTNRTPHASFDNTSDIIRWSLDLRYQSDALPTNAEEDPATYTEERDPVTMACYPPEADFVLQDPAHPEREIRTAEAFHAVRERYEQAHPAFPGRGWTRYADRTT